VLAELKVLSFPLPMLSAARVPSVSKPRVPWNCYLSPLSLYGAPRRARGKQERQQTTPNRGSSPFGVRTRPQRARRIAALIVRSPFPSLRPVAPRVSSPRRDSSSETRRGLSSTKLLFERPGEVPPSFSPRSSPACRPRSFACFEIRDCGLVVTRIGISYPLLLERGDLDTRHEMEKEDLVPRMFSSSGMITRHFPLLARRRGGPAPRRGPTTDR